MLLWFVIEVAWFVDLILIDRALPAMGMHSLHKKLEQGSLYLLPESDDLRETG